MKIGILGSGDVAKTLGAGFLAHGHDVVLGTREPARLAEWSKRHPKGRVGDFSRTADHGDVLVLAVKGSAAAAALREAGIDYLDGKVIIDATNPIADTAPVNGVLKFFTSLDDSLLERLQRAFPDARFVKAFNSVGHARMVDPDFGGIRPTMFICGNDDKAKAAVAKLLDQLGWDAADMGKAEAARAIEPLCMLWCIRGFRDGQWSHAFKLLT